MLYHLYHATAPTQRFQSGRLESPAMFDVFQLYHVAVAALVYSEHCVFLTSQATWLRTLLCASRRRSGEAVTHVI